MTDELKDKRGVVWSEDHHDPQQKKTNAGNWKAKKGGDAAERKAYESLFIVPEQKPGEEKGWRNESGGPFDMFNLSWKPGQCRDDVPKDIENCQKFKYAVKLKLLVKI